MNGSSSSISSSSSSSTSSSASSAGRPHTRTQCHETTNCPGTNYTLCVDLCKCHHSFSMSSSTHLLEDSPSSDADSGLFVMPSARAALTGGAGSGAGCSSVGGAGGLGGSGPAVGSMSRYKQLHPLASNMSSVSTAADKEKAPRAVHIVELPAEVLVKILGFLSFKNLSGCRLVSRRFNELCASMLNSTFQKLQGNMLNRFQSIKNKMPRRESARRNHPLARECDIVETLHMRLTLLQMTFGKHIERKHVCFFAGEILDEVYSILRYIRNTPNLARAFKVTDELFDLSTMAMEYFKEHIEPTLPEITIFGAEFLDFTTPFTTPTKRRSQSGASSSLLDLESPCSSRDSLAGSSFSEPWSNSHPCDKDDDSTTGPAAGPAPGGGSGSNMVLRKRIKKIRIGMKRYNDQLVEVKRELKSCKTKMEAQSKQVAEYSQRLEDYDKKFEDSTRKLQTLLTELNKCKTELQFWRSKSTALLGSTSGSSASAAGASAASPVDPSAPAPLFCANCDTALGAKQPDQQDWKESPEELKALVNQGIIEEPKTSPPRPATRGSMSGPPSPAPLPTAAGSRKRRVNTDEAGDATAHGPPRKSSRVNSEDSSSESCSPLGSRKSLRVAGAKKQK